MDRATLEHEYNARESVASFDAEYARYVAESERVKQSLAAARDIVYDVRSGERLDLYRAGGSSPVFLWIHGGYWRGGSKEDNAFAAGGLTAHGISVAVMNYTLAPEAGIDEMVRQVRSAVAWLKRNGAKHGLDAHRIHVGGSSAGGHLAGMLLAGGWLETFGLPEDTLGTVLALSGLHELEPLQHTQVNSWMHFDAASIAENSPIRLIPERTGARLIASVGGRETGEFIRQTLDYAAAWQRAGHATQVIDMPSHNHFDIALSLCEPDGALVEALCASIARDAEGETF
ncbi:alpha/beta hydrolase [Nitratireductor sp. ZSWI3]|uniref:alpha/beta hydrolase n=1 Tax=Nitratireductor sp. ZSWI3 TaxID=2966359 RepID=UPI00214F6C90|nr:alpha/beta hydrolase [Nitratireductor sp. ZSWI3]MCR4267574.1 alpha/beta hydrolase [Nitratireductor sp. ZSWI3]